MTTTLITCGKSYQQSLRSGAKKSGRKREVPPCTPYKRKARGKEARPGSFQNPPRPRGRALTREEQQQRFEEAGIGAMEIVSIIGSHRRDFGTWAKILYRHIEQKTLIVDMAYKYFGEQKVGELKNAVTRFQKFLNDNFPKPNGGAE